MKLALTTRFYSLFTKKPAIFSLLLILCLNGNAFAQFDSMDVSLTIVSRDYQDGDIIVPQNWLHLAIVPNDLSDLGHLEIVVYSHNDGSVLRVISKTKQELIDEGSITGDTIVCDPFVYDPYFVYRITISPQNNAGAYAQDYTLFYPEQP